MTLEELPGVLQANTCFIIEDYTTQVGQGGIRERGPEMLAQTDVKPILLRKIWLREVAALLEGPQNQALDHADTSLTARFGPIGVRRSRPGYLTSWINHEKTWGVTIRVGYGSRPGPRAGPRGHRQSG